MHLRNLLFLLLSVLLIDSCLARDFEDITQSGYLRVGTTGDYPPLTERDRKNNYQGFAIDMAQSLGQYLSKKSGHNIKVEFILTYWSDLHDDLNRDAFDIAMGGITRNLHREKQFLVSDNVIPSGKVALIRKEHYPKVTGLNDQPLIAALNRPEIRLVENPGGTNLLFARKHLPNAQLMITADNKEPFLALRENKADVMITDLIETRYRIQSEPELTIVNEATFTETRSHKVYLMQKNNKPLLKAVNAWLAETDIQAIQKRWF